MRKHEPNRQVSRAACPAKQLWAELTRRLAFAVQDDEYRSRAIDLPGGQFNCLFQLAGPKKNVTRPSDWPVYICSSARISLRENTSE